MLNKYKPFNTSGIILEMSEPLVIERPTKPLRKVMLTLQTNDGQTFYAELRNHKIKLIQSNNLKVKDKVDITFVFQGSEKNGKKYNNIYLVDIKHSK